MKKYLYVLSILIGLYSCNEKPENKKQVKTDIVEDRQEILTSESKEQYEPPVKNTISDYLEKSGFINIHSLDPTIKIDLKYSTTDNFTKTVLYDSLHEAFLHPLAANKLIKAQALLKQHNPNLSLLVLDAARPLSVQKKMYAVVQNTPYKAYVANPSKTGLHNYGIAVDLTICKNDGTLLDMGTPFDYFGKAAGINQEEQLIVEGKLTREQVENRKLLRRVMTQAGFLTIRGEWWHFNACSLNDAKKHAMLIN